MAHYRLRVGASGPPDSTPLWRIAMADTDKVYEAGYAWNDATYGLVAKYIWPEAGKGGYQYQGTDGTNSPFHHAFGGCVFLTSQGAHGTFAYFGTGEAIIQDQISKWPFSDDNPEWGLLQQPGYQTTEAEAIAADADWYYNPTDASDNAVVPSGKQFTTEADFSGWDKTFPLSFQGWVIRRKYGTGTGSTLLGNQRPHFGRYSMPQAIPAAHTGTGAEAIIVTSLGPIYGPFAQGPRPQGVGVTEADMFAEVWSTNERKNWLYAMNVQTGEWQRLTPAMPQGFLPNTADQPHACYDHVNRRIYYMANYNGANALVYANLSDGLAAISISSPPIELTGSSVPSLTANSVLCIPSFGVNAGKPLWLFKKSTGELLIVDIDAETVRTLAIAGLPSASEWWLFSYDQENNRVIITTKDTSFGVRSYRFVIPDDYTDPTEYSIAMTTLDLNGITLEAVTDPYQYGDRGRYHPELGIILITQRLGKNLAYRPGA